MIYRYRCAKLTTNAKLLKLCTKLELFPGLTAITYMALTKLNLKTELSHKFAT